MRQRKRGVSAWFMLRCMEYGPDFNANLYVFATKKYAILDIQSVPGMCQISGGCPYVYRYNPKHLCPNVNGYGDNGQRKVWSSFGSTHCTCQLTSLIDVCPWLRYRSISAVFVAPAIQAAMLSECVTYSAWNSKDSYDMVCEIFVVQFNGVTSLTS
jgi:hypothetical protein